MMQYYFNNITVIQVINKYLASEDYFVRYQKKTKNDYIICEMPSVNLVVVVV